MTSPQQIALAAYVIVATINTVIAVIVGGKRGEDADDVLLGVVLFGVCWPLWIPIGALYIVFHGLYAFGEWLADREDRATVKETEPELPEARVRRAK